MKLMHREVANCGTYGGYQTHKKLGQEPCLPCNEARNTYIREYRRRKGHTTSTLMPVDAQCPNCGHHITAGAA
jgi:ribosomal protein L32